MNPVETTQLPAPPKGVDQTVSELLKQWRAEDAANAQVAVEPQQLPAAQANLRA